MRVIEDSVKMLYEALSADFAPGLPGLQRFRDRESKHTLGVVLLAEGFVTDFDEWQTRAR